MMNNLFQMSVTKDYETHDFSTNPSHFVDYTCSASAIHIVAYEECVENGALRNTPMQYTAIRILIFFLLFKAVLTCTHNICFRAKIRK